MVILSLLSLLNLPRITTPFQMLFPLSSLNLSSVPDNTPLRSSLVAEANVVELYREEPEEELGLRIVGGKDTPLGNIVIQEIVRDSIAARDGRLAPGDHILEVQETQQKGDFADIMYSIVTNAEFIRLLGLPYRIARHVFT